MDKKRYCEKCGLELSEKLEFYKHDKNDGDPLYKKIFICPNKKLFNSHDKYLDAQYSCVTMNTRLYNQDGTFAYSESKWTD